MTRSNQFLIRDLAYFGVGLLCSAAAAYSNRPPRRHPFRGRVVFITGSSRGLGLALAEEFADFGSRIVLVARDANELARARDQILRVVPSVVPNDVLTIAADLRKTEDAQAAIAVATRQFGQVDILVNNAGVITVGPIENQSVDRFHEAMDSNFFTAVHCTLSVLPQMLARCEGKIVNITSIGGKVAVPHLLPYTASKFAAVGLSEGLNVELRSKGIRVTTVCPGLMRTGSHINAFFAGDASREYRWFSLAANLPGASIAAHRAARKIVRGVATGAREITITPQAFLAARFGNVAPWVTQFLMQGIHWFLPDPVDGADGAVRGGEVADRETFPAARIGSSAARRYNQTAPASSSS